MTGPDFIILGAMKCGTTTLAAQLGAQQGVFMTEPKEPNFFSDDDIFARGADWYEALFEGAAPGDIRGEASTHYTKRPDLPETLSRMQAAGLAPKLVYMIRDPMARLVSHYIHDWSQAVLSVPLAEALDSHPQLVDYGLYGWQISPYIEAFGADAVLLTSLERMKADQTGELARVAAHLGHAGPVTWVEDRETENVSAARTRKLPLHGLIVESAVATALRRALVPKWVRTRIREARQFKGRPEIPANRIAPLRARFSEDRKVLASLFPDDPSLDMAYPWLG